MYALPRNAFCQVGVPEASLGARWCGSLLLCDAQFVPLARVATIGTIRQVAVRPRNYHEGVLGLSGFHLNRREQTLETRSHRRSQE